MLTEDLWYRVAGRPLRVCTTQPGVDGEATYEVVDLTPDLLVCRRLHLWEGPGGRSWIRGAEGEEVIFFLKHVLALRLAAPYPILDPQPQPAEGGAP